MHYLYTIAVHIASFFLRLGTIFSAKIKLFVNGRKNTFLFLRTNIGKNDAVIWVHTASLGEFEQGLPIIQKLKIAYPSHKILITFFSPSGYEVKKNAAIADIVTYLPLDTKSNAEQFISLVRPKLAIFVKYEIWPNYLRALAENKIPALLISAIFRKEQIFFKWYGGFIRKGLSRFHHIFVQDQNSANLLYSINFKNSTISGDTRFDRVVEILGEDNTLGFMQQFKQEYLCLVAGSTWPEDEAILTNNINTSSDTTKYVLVPHNIKANHISSLKKSISKKTVLYSEIYDKDISDFKVLIIDTIGLLTKIYSYADIAYVGGGFSTGLHNTLEAAVFGIPVLIGPNFKGFKEAEDMVVLKGVLPIKSDTDFDGIMTDLKERSDFLEHTGEINRVYILKNKGASKLIMKYIRTLL